MVSFIRATATISVLTAGSRVVGFLREAIMATYLGCSGSSDALVVAIKFPSVFRRILAEGAFNPAFIPTFIKIVETDGRAEARHYAEEIFSILIIVLLTLTLLVELFMAYPIRVLFPGFEATEERFDLAMRFSRVTFPFVALISLTAFYGCILNSINQFAVFAASPMIGNIGIITVVLILTGLTNIQAGIAFSVGITACGLVQFVWVLIPAIRYGLFLRFRRPRVTKRVEQFFLALGPSIISSCAVQIGILVDNTLASLLSEGNVSILHYADRLNQLPLSVFGTAVGTALLPFLSRQIQSGLREKVIESQSIALEYSILLILPSTLTLTLLSFPIVRVLYVHGQFTLEDANTTAHTLAALASGLPAYILIKIFTVTFFASQNTKTPLYTGLAAVGINIILSLILMKPFSCVGLALATALSSWVQACIMGGLLIQRNQLEITKRLKRFLYRVSIVSLLSCGLFLALRRLTTPWMEQGKLLQICVLTILITGSMLSFFLLAKFLGVLRPGEIRARLRTNEELEQLVRRQV